MGFSFLVWNVRQFQASTQARIERVSDLVLGLDPDVFAILEFRAKDAARRLIRDHFMDYDFGLTDSKIQLEILVGFRRARFSQVLYTQRRDFQAGSINLRPGGLLSVREWNETAFHNLLFLHTDSGKTSGDYDRRQAMFGKIWSLNGALEQLPIQGGRARLIALGDLNTMGRSRSGGLPTIRASTEIQNLTQAATTNGMGLLTKSASKTWSNKSGSKRSELDHAIASTDLQLQSWTDPDREISPYEIEVNGWGELTGTARRTFLEHISDHSSLYGEVV